MRSQLWSPWKWNSSTVCPVKIASWPSGACCYDGILTKTRAPEQATIWPRRWCKDCKCILNGTMVTRVQFCLERFEHVQHLYWKWNSAMDSNFIWKLDEFCFHCWKLKIETLGAWMLNKLHDLLVHLTRCSNDSAASNASNDLVKWKMNYWKSLNNWIEHKIININMYQK